LLQLKWRNAYAQSQVLELQSMQVYTQELPLQQGSSHRFASSQQGSSWGSSSQQQYIHSKAAGGAAGAQPASSSQRDQWLPAKALRCPVAQGN
jgi:hypothetical protein